MQGRLSRQDPRGYQTFPSETWQAEFNVAATLNLNHIEWVIETFHIMTNPLICSPEQIEAVARNSGVAVISACADFLMDLPLRPLDRRTWSILTTVLEHASSLGVEVLVIPCVDNSSLLIKENLENLESSLPRMLRLAERNSIQLALETDLPPQDFSVLLEKFQTPFLTVNYDSGNSASLGYRFKEEMENYGARISDFHIKDRVAFGPSVPLGSGDAPLSSVISHLKREASGSIVTLQAAREGDAHEAARNQLAWLQDCMASLEIEDL